MNDHIFGTKGRVDVMKHIGSMTTKAKRSGGTTAPQTNMYQVEHDELFASIRSGKPINNGHYMAQQHDDGHHGPHGRLHGPADHLGTGDEFQAKT